MAPKFKNWKQFFYKHMYKFFQFEIAFITLKY